MKTQVIFIHGGETFETYEEYMSFLRDCAVDLDKLRNRKWAENLQSELGDNFDVIVMRMPCKYNAKYSEWKLWFEKHIPLFNDEVILIGHSLGGIFLAKYLSENKFPKKLLGVFLVSSPYDSEASGYDLLDFSLTGGLKQLEEQAGNIFLYHSKDDDVCPFADFEKYRKALPNANTEVFEDREHINQETFPEIVRDIKNLSPLT